MNCERFWEHLSSQSWFRGQTSLISKRRPSPPLDRTLVLNVSSNSKTHNNRNYPLLLAGGKGPGVKHGQYLRYKENQMPLPNLFVTMLDRLGIPTEHFADSTAEFSDILA